MSHPLLARWTPDRPPERTDALLVGVAVFFCWLAASETTPVAWPWAVVGFGSTALAVGPLTDTAVGQRVAAAVRALGPRAGKAVALAFVVAFATTFTWTVPDDVGRAVAVGGCAFLALSLVANGLPAAHARLAGHST